MIDIDDVIAELEKITGTEKVKKMIIDLYEEMENYLFDYQDEKEREMQSLIYYTKSLDEEEDDVR